MSSKVVQFTALQESALQGFCGAMRRSGILPIWHVIMNAATITEMRKFIMEAFETSRKDLQIDKGRHNPKWYRNYLNWTQDVPRDTTKNANKFAS